MNGFTGIIGFLTLSSLCNRTLSKDTNNAWNIIMLCIYYLIQGRYDNNT